MRIPIVALDCAVGLRRHGGSNLDEWVSAKDESPAKWTVANGIVTVNKPSGDIHTKRKFTNYQLHIEWRVPTDVHDTHGNRFAATSPWIAWSYGDIAMVDHTDAAFDVLLACKAGGRTCEPLPAERPFLMPTN